MVGKNSYSSAIVKMATNSHKRLPADSRQGVLPCYSHCKLRLIKVAPGELKALISYLPGYAAHFASLGQPAALRPGTCLAEAAIHLVPEIHPVGTGSNASPNGTCAY